jgi:hypothetical protein
MSHHKHKPRFSGAGIRQTFGDHPWRARLRAAMDGKPTTKVDAAAKETADEREQVSV